MAVSLSRHLTDLKKSFDSGVSNARVTEALISVEMLAIDELDNLRTGWQQQTLLDLIQGRYDEGRPILITTNRDEAGLKKLFGEAGAGVVSRLRTCAPIYRLEGPDLRG